ncbi:MAG: hypothetical protein ACOX3T_04870 [Bdellovibrionota bacterium]
MRKIFSFLLTNLLSNILLSLLVSFVSLCFLPSVSFSASSTTTDITIQGAGKRFPIAVTSICNQTSHNLEPDKTIISNLDVSGYFNVLNPETYIESKGKCDDSSFAYSDWSIIGAEGLVKGVALNEGGQIKVKMYLHDVVRQGVVVAKEYKISSPAQISTVANRFSNVILEYFTGTSSFFGSQIAFSGRVGRFKELFLMNANGTDIRQVTNDRGLVLSTSWSPTGSDLIYTSYRNRAPDLFRYSLVNRRLLQLTTGNALEIGGQFSPDGNTILYSRTRGSAADLILADLSGKTIRNVLVEGGIINVSPSWSPDGKEIVFCSNRGGGPQIYRMSSSGANIKRVSFVSSNYCTSPAWSPVGDKLTFVCRAEGRFQLFVTDVDGSNAQQLTTYGNNEDPSWSPDGRYIAFASTFGSSRVFNIAVIKSDGSNLRQLTFSSTGYTDPAWGPVE